MIRKLFLGIVITGAVATAAHADKCVPDPSLICPDIYAPVICNDGVTYPNQCYADRVCAVGCHPA